MVPVAISLLGAGLRRDTVAFMGWVGPRGLASVVFTLVAVETLTPRVRRSTPSSKSATWTILLSVIAHGLSAGPLARAYGRRIQDVGSDAPELSTNPNLACGGVTLEGVRTEPGRDSEHVDPVVLDADDGPPFVAALSSACSAPLV